MNISLSEEMYSFILERVRAEYHSFGERVYSSPYPPRPVEARGGARPDRISATAKSKRCFTDFNRGPVPIDEKP